MNGKLLSRDLGKIFNRIHPSWKKIFMSEKLKPELDNCLLKISNDLESKGVGYNNIVKNGLSAYIRPAPDQIFEAFRHFDAHNTRAIIIGQDPYPDAAHAHGLSFSSKASKTPDSLKNIYKCLYHSGLISTIPEKSDLTGWAEQGVLLLNSMLTRTPNIVKDESGACYISGNTGNCKHAFWIKFTALFLQALQNWLDIQDAEHNQIFILLWGNDAQKLEPFIDLKRPGPLRVLKWGHPSSTSRLNNTDSNPAAFINCDHFDLISQVYPSIVWDPNYKTSENLKDQFWQIRRNLCYNNPSDCCPSEQAVEINWLLNTRDPKRIYDDKTNTAENLKIRSFIAQQARSRTVLNKPAEHQIVVFTDGGCQGNGKDTAKAAMGVYFPECFNGNLTATGVIKIGKNIPDKQQLYDTASKTIISTCWTKRTNQRAELFASIYAFKTMYEKWTDWQPKNPSSVLFITDSLKYVISWAGSRIYKEYKRDRKFTTVANSDLVKLLCRFMWMFGRAVLQSRNNTTEKYSFSDVENLFVNDKFLVLQHQNSHLNEKQKSALTKYQMELCLGNECADQLCNAAMNAS